MALLKKFLVPSIGLLLAFYFYHVMDNFRPDMLQGKRVIVTGASTGIGEQIAYHLAQMGAHLVVTARTEAKLQKVISKCLKLGAASAHFISGTMEDLIFAEQVVTKAGKLMGGLDMLILNHVRTEKFTFFNDVVPNIQKRMKVNFFSYVVMTKAALPMLKASNGSIVVISSLAGRLSFPYLSGYSASKFALDGFYSSVREELQIKNINVSITLCILGYIDTENAVKIVSKHAKDVKPASKEDCALEIIKAGALRQKEMVYPVPLFIWIWYPNRMIIEYINRKKYNGDIWKENEVK